MSTPVNPQDPTPTPAPQPPPAVPPEPKPADPGADQHAELRATLNQLSQEKDALHRELTAQKTSAGRFRAELGLSKDADDDAHLEALRTLRALKKQGSEPTSDPSSEGKTYTEAQYNEAITQAATRKEAELADTITTLKAETKKADALWRNDRVTTQVTTACAESEVPLNSKLVLALTRQRGNYPWHIIADPDGEGVKVVKWDDEAEQPYYSPDKAKYFKLGDALAVVAADNPGVSMVSPKVGQHASRGVTGGPAPLSHNDPSRMTPEEKVAGVFKK